MSKDDYHVIVYRVLLYFYDCLKKGVEPNAEELNQIALLAEVNERYWHYILKSLMDYQFIEGAIRIKTDNSYERITHLECANITPLGIEYLTDNSFMAKVKDFLKEAKAIAPFV